MNWVWAQLRMVLFCNECCQGVTLIVPKLGDYVRRAPPQLQLVRERLFFFSMRGDGEKNGVAMVTVLRAWIG
jgi:hypothetical protein